MAATAACDRCGTENPAGSERCLGCGCTLSAPKVPEPEQKTRPGRRQALKGAAVAAILVLAGLRFVRHRQEDLKRAREAREKAQRTADERRRLVRQPPEPGDRGVLKVTAASFGATGAEAFEDYSRACAERDDIRRE